MSPRNVNDGLCSLGCGTGYVECDLGSVVSDVQSAFLCGDVSVVCLWCAVLTCDVFVQGCAPLPVHVVCALRYVYILPMHVLYALRSVNLQLNVRIVISFLVD